MVSFPTMAVLGRYVAFLSAVGNGSRLWTGNLPCRAENALGLFATFTDRNLCSFEIKVMEQCLLAMT